MKKLLSITLSVLMLFSFTSCKNTNINDVQNAKLGNKVSSLTYQTNDGELLTIDENSEIPILIQKLNCDFTFLKEGTKVSLNASIKKENTPHIHSNIEFYNDKYSFYKKEEMFSSEEDSSLKREYYTYSNPNAIEGEVSSKAYSKYTYKSYKAFNGIDVIKGSDYSRSNIFEPYLDSHYKYPHDTDVFEPLLTYHDNFSTFISYNLMFDTRTSIEQDGTIYDFKDYIKFEMNLYENYIVITRVAPFINLDGYRQLNNINDNIQENNEVIQTVYFNLEKGRIDFVSLEGKTNALYLGSLEYINLSYSIEDLNQDEMNKSTKHLENYIKRRSTFTFYLFNLLILLIPLVALIVLLIILKKHKKNKINNTNNQEPQPTIKPKEEIIDNTPVKQSSIY